MAVQQNKVSKSRRNNRRAHDALSAAARNECPNCGDLKRPHHVCGACGHYDDKEIIARSMKSSSTKTQHKQGCGSGPGRIAELLWDPLSGPV